MIKTLNKQDLQPSSLLQGRLEVAPKQLRWSLISVAVSLLFGHYDWFPIVKLLLLKFTICYAFDRKAT